MILPPTTPETRVQDARRPDPAANPYLAFSAVLAAGLKGIEEELELCPPMEEDSAHGLPLLVLRIMV